MNAESRRRWQLLRRNPRYRKDYQALANHLRKDPAQFLTEFQPVWMALYMETAAKVEGRFPGVDIGIVRSGFVELGRFKERWGTSRPVAPEVEEPEDLTLHCPGSGEGNPEVPCVEVKAPSAADDLPPILELQVRLDAPMRDILGRMREILEIHQRLYAEAMEDPEFRSPRAARFEEMLRIFDAVETSHGDWDRVLSMVYPEVVLSGPEEKARVLGRAKNLYEEAKLRIDLAPESPESRKNETTEEPSNS